MPQDESGDAPKRSVLPPEYKTILDGNAAQGESDLPTQNRSTNAIELSSTRESLAGGQGHAKWERKSDGSIDIRYELEFQREASRPIDAAGSSTTNKNDRIPDTMREYISRNNSGILITTDQTRNDKKFFGFGSDSMLKLSDTFYQIHSERQFDPNGFLAEQRSTSTVSAGTGQPNVYKSGNEHYRNGIIESSDYHSNWKSSDSTNTFGHVDGNQRYDEKGRLLSSTRSVEENSSAKDIASGKDVASYSSSNSTVDRNSDSTYSTHEFSQTKVDGKVTSEKDVTYISKWDQGGYQETIIGGTGTETGPDGNKKQIQYDPEKQKWTSGDEKPADHARLVPEKAHRSDLAALKKIHSNSIEAVSAMMPKTAAPMVSAGILPKNQMHFVQPHRGMGLALS